MSREKIIDSNPEILGGEPAFAGTRVPIKSLFDHLEAGDSIEDFLEGFPSVRRHQVITLLRRRGGSMKLVVGNMYSITFANGESDVIRVYSDDGNGWYTVKGAYWDVEAQAKARSKSININNAVSIEEYHY